MILRSFSFLFGAIISTVVCFGQEWNGLGAGAPQPDAALYDQYGYSISMDGNIAVIGAPGNDDHNVNAGKAFVYEKTNGQWQLISELSSFSSDPEVQFGKTVLVKDGVVLVGAPGFNGFGTIQEGAVGVYKRNTEGWSMVNTLRNNNPSAYDHFGFSLALHNGVVAVGAPGDTDPLVNSGAVYLFENIETETLPVAKITAPSGETDFKFGMTVALNAESIFVGDTRSKVNNTNKGAVFVFNFNTHEIQAKLTTTHDVFLFGSSLASTENELAVSAWGSNSNNSYGSVYIFDKPVGNWVNATEDIQLIPANGNDYGIYGSTLHLDDESLVVGSDGGTVVDFYDKPATNWGDIGEPYSLKKSNFTYIQRYGFSFSVSGSDAIVGAYNWNELAEASGGAFAYEKSGQSWSSLVEKATLKEVSATATGDKLGFSVDIDGVYAVAGAPYDDTHGESSGAAYVFKFNGTSWERLAKLTPSDGTELDYFGWSVAISGNTIVVSALEAAPTNEGEIYSTGKVYVFEKPPGEWASANETTQIHRIDNSHQGSFGFNLDIEQDEIVISHFNSGSSDEIALVYVYVRSGIEWQQKAKLSPSNTSFRQFGSDVVLKNNLIAVGAPISENFDGSVLIFEKPTSGWDNANPDAVLRPSDARLYGYFGSSVDINGSTVLVGATGSSGAAYIFEKEGDWKDATEDAKLLPNTTAIDAHYGSSVALGIDFAVVASNSIYGSGRAIIFKKINGYWKNTEEYTVVSSYQEGDQFGNNLALYKDFLIAGTPGSASESGSNSGAAFFYIKQPTVVKVDSDNEDGTYKPNDKIKIKVVFSQPIELSANPKLRIALDNNVTHDLLFKNLTNELELNFEYIVAENDYSDDLDYKGTDALLIDFWQIKSKINAAYSVVDLPWPGSPYSLSGLRDLVIDGFIVGIEDPMHNDIKVYPNPFTNAFQISVSEEASITLTSLNGTQLCKAILHENQSCSPNIQQGLYILEVITKSGMTKRLKVIKVQ